MSRPPDAGRATFALLALFVVGVYHRALLGFGVFFQRDIAAYWVPHVEALVATLAQRTGPWWNPWVAFGAPLLAEPSLQVAYPPTWLNLLLLPSQYYPLFVAGHAVLGGWGAMRLARKRGLDPFAVALVGLAFAGSGPLTSAANLWHHYAGAAWMPWVLAAVEDVLERPSARSAARLGLLAGAQSLAGSADLCLMTALAALVRSLPRLARARTLALLSAGAASLVLAALVGAVQWLPTLLDLGQGSRGSMAASTRLYWSLHPASLIDLLVPGLLASGPLTTSARAALFEGREPLLGWIYLGSSMLGLVVLGLPRRRASAGLVVALALFLALALGRHLPPAAWAGGLPPLGLIRYPTKHLLPVALFWALLAGTGMQRWRVDWDAAACRRGRWLAFALTGLALLMVGAAATLVLAPGVVPFWSEPGGGSAAGGLTHAGLAVFAAAAMMFVRSRTAAAGPWSAAMLGLVALDLFPVAASVNPLAPPPLLEHRPAVVDHLRAAAPATRVYSQPLALDALQRAIVRGPAEWQAEPRFALATLELLRPPQGVRWQLRGSFDGDFTGLAPPLLGPLGGLVSEHRADLLGLRLLQLANVGHVVSLEPQPFGGQLQETARVDSVFASPIRVHGVPEPVPPVYLVGAALEVEVPLVPAVFAEPEFDPQRVAVVAPGSGLGLPPWAPVPGDVRVVERSPGRLHVETRTTAPGLLVVVEALRLGWSAWIDGRPASLRRANLLFIGVPVPAGAHDVELRYVPPGLTWGTVCSLAGLLLGLVLAARPVVEAERTPL